MPGLFILSLLELLTWVQAEVPPVMAVGAAGVLVVVALELLSTRLSPAVPGAIEPLWWWLAFLALAPGLGLPVAAAVAAVGFVVVLELAGRSRRPAWALAVPAMLAAGLVPSTAERPWSTVGVLAAASVWAMVRRLAPFEGRWAGTRPRPGGRDPARGRCAGPRPDDVPVDRPRGGSGTRGGLDGPGDPTAARTRCPGSVLDDALDRVGWACVVGRLGRVVGGRLGRGCRGGLG